MNNNLGKGGLPFLAVPVIIAALFFFSPSIGKTVLIAAVTGLLIFGIFVIGVVIWAMMDGRSEAKKRSSSSPAGEDDELKDVKRCITDIRLTVRTIDDDDISAGGEKVCGRASDILDTIREQPEEIKRTAQFRKYYLPALLNVFTQYRALEKSGNLRPGDKEKVMSFLDDAMKAFDSQYSALFSDEQFNMDVEIRAARMIFERDGRLAKEEETAR